MRELDVLLTRYLEEKYAAADPQEQAAFRALLERQDPEVYGLLLGRLAPEDDALARVLDALRLGR
jgi:antitoxin CptB